MAQLQDDTYYVEQVCSGNQEAFRTLVERYSGLAYHIAYRMCRHPQTAEDAVQEVFYRVYKSLASYNSQWSFKFWVRRITVNYLLDTMKKKQVNTISMTHEDGSEYEFLDNSGGPAQSHFEAERERLLHNAVAALPPQQRMAVILRHFENLSYQEIAETMQMPLGTVMTQLHRGRKKLADTLAPLQNDLLE